MTTLNQAIELFTHLVDYIGIGIIFWGVAVGLIGFISMQLPSRKEIDVLQANAVLRCKIGTNTIFTRDRHPPVFCSQK